MKLFAYLALPLASTLAFAPDRASRVLPHHRGGALALNSKIDEVSEKITSTTDEYVSKADDLVLGRVMRVVDHAPALFTLKGLADAGGVSASLSGITSNPETFTGLATALSVPKFMFNVWAAICAFQALSIAKSALASDGNELSQADITATAAANWAATRAIGSATPLRDTILTALVSGYAVRNGSAGGDATIHSAGLQMMSSFTSVLAVLGLVSSVAAKIPMVSDSANLVSLLGIAAYYVMVTREGNGTVKKAVNAGVLGGMLVSSLKGGVSISLSVCSLVSNVLLAGTAYLAYEGVNRLKTAVFA